EHEVRRHQERAEPIRQGRRGRRIPAAGEPEAVLQIPPRSMEIVDRVGGRKVTAIRQLVEVLPATFRELFDVSRWYERCLPATRQLSEKSDVVLLEKLKSCRVAGRALVSKDL